ncbi:MAG: hypothetical protein V1816_07070 [Pseudomonadota bacterium]
MNGKDYVVEAVELATRLVAEVRESKILTDDSVLDQASQACADLEQVKGKATLRTKDGTNKAFPVVEAARNIGEAWEEARDAGEPDELGDRFEEFRTAVKALVSSLQERTVIMT